MKYIRTKDDIYELYKKQGNIEMVFNVKPKCVLETKGYQIVAKERVIKVGDTIEELCDEFVGIDSQGHYIIHNNQWLDGARIVPLEDIKYYGAIWTDKGLIYIAKMNDKGELELI